MKKNKYFQSPRLEIIRILIEELQGWESTTKVSDVEMYKLVDRLAAVKNLNPKVKIK